MPKNVAITFANKWKAEFSAVNKINVADLQKSPGKKSVTVIGGNVVIHKNIINWMLWCCEGRGIRPFANPAFKAFTYLYFARACAVTIGCDYLVNNITKRMDSLSNGQIHSEDVRAFYLMNPQDLEMQKFLVEHVAIRFWEKTLKAKGAYRTLREELPEFNKAIDEFLDARKEMRKKETRAKRLVRGRLERQSIPRPERERRRRTT